MGKIPSRKDNKVLNQNKACVDLIVWFIRSDTPSNFVLPQISSVSSGKMLTWAGLHAKGKDMVTIKRQMFVSSSSGLRKISIWGFILKLSACRIIHLRSEACLGERFPFHLQSKFEHAGCFCLCAAGVHIHSRPRGVVYELWSEQKTCVNIDYHYWVPESLSISSPSASFPLQT